jgi:hypothetical protein
MKEKVVFELRNVVIRLHMKLNAKFKNSQGWLKEISYNVGAKQRCPLSPTLFGVYIDKLEACLDKAGCIGTTLARIIIIFFFISG